MDLGPSSPTYLSPPRFLPPRQFCLRLLHDLGSDGADGSVRIRFLVRRSGYDHLGVGGGLLLHLYRGGQSGRNLFRVPGELRQKTAEIGRNLGHMSAPIMKSSAVWQKSGRSLVETLLDVCDSLKPQRKRRGKREVFLFYNENRIQMSVVWKYQKRGL